MTYSCLVTRKAITREFYAIPFIFNELSTLEGIRKYSHPLSRSININNEIYKVALLPIRGICEDNKLIIIKNHASQFFQEKTGQSMQILLDDITANTQKTADIYFANDRYRQDRNMSAALIDSTVFDKLINTMSLSKTLWEDIAFADSCVFESLGFSSEPDQGYTVYQNIEDEEIEIISKNNTSFLRLNNKDYKFHSVKEFEEILNKSNKTLGPDFVEFSKETKNNKWLNLYYIKNSCLHEDISDSFFRFYGKDIYKLMGEYSRLTEILTILDYANILLDKPKYVPSSGCDDFVNNMNRILFNS